MKKLFIAMGISAAALLGGTAANAADSTVKAKAATDVTQSSTDISSRHRYHHYGYRHHYRHYGYRHYRPHYSYGYAPRPFIATATLRGRNIAVMAAVTVMAVRA